MSAHPSQAINLQAKAAENSCSRFSANICQIDRLSSKTHFTRSRTALLVSALSIWLPWPIRRWLLATICHYSIARDARIGWSLIGCPILIMRSKARIGHFNVLKGAIVEMEEQASIGDFNWISGLALGSKRHFRDEFDRLPLLQVGQHAALTSRHLVDCSNQVHIGDFSIVAGARSQILTHSIDFTNCLQKSASVHIGRYCFVGTACVILRGARLPDHSVLAAHSCLAGQFNEPFTLYSGVPATAQKSLDRNAAFFHRQQGYVD